ncbi:RidA family protein [Rhodoplanes sp. SY1]|uniref:RidA family protein n=1 Tax=Rhodoplanes sp. SY1 TaxID=3166646 RepID=UPI0038B59C2C
MSIESRLQELGLVLPPPPALPPGTVLPFAPVRVVGRRALISGHGPVLPDGRLWAQPGRVGDGVSLDDAREAARLTGLSILTSLKRELGSLDRVSAWVRAFGMVTSAPGFQAMPAVINGFSDLILAVYGPERGQHARSAIGVAELPFGIAVEIEAEVEID